MNSEFFRKALILLNLFYVIYVICHRTGGVVIQPPFDIRLDLYRLPC